MATEVKTTIFRFVKVRPPRKPARSAVQSGFVKYDESNGSDLYGSLAGIRSDSNLSDDAKRTQMISAVQNFKSTADYFQDEEALATALGEDRIEFAMKLSEKVFNLKEEDLPANTNLSLSGPTELKLWDNVFASYISGNLPELRELILLILKSNHFINQFQSLSGNIKALRRLAKADIVLPSGIFPLPIKPKAAVPKPNKLDNSEQIIEHQESLNALGTVKGELQKLWESNIKTAKRGTEGNPPESKITTSAWSAFSEPTVTLLNSLNIAVGDNILESVSEINTKMAEDYSKMWKNVSSSRKVVVTRRGVYVEERVQRREAEESGTYDPIPEDVFQWMTPDDPYQNFFASNRPPLRCISVGDYIRVEQELCCYEPGEVADIKNVMQGEFMKHSTRRLKQKETNVTTESEQEEEKETDSQTADRYELEKETDKTLSMDMSLDLGVSVSAQYGPVSASMNTQFSSGFSSTQSEHQAVNYSKEVMERTVNRIRKRVREERKTRTFEEVEVLVDHEYDNRGNNNSGGHIVGLYRWVDKIYNAQLVNYGKRMMMEFMIPEPAAFHLWAMTQRENPADAVVLDEPIHPKDMVITYTSNSNGNPLIQVNGLKSADDISETNYLYWAAEYGASVEAPPPSIKKVVVGMVEDVGDTGKDKYAGRIKSDFVVEEGFMATEISANIGFEAASIRVFIGNVEVSFNSQLSLSLPNLMGKIEIVMYANKLKAVAVGLKFALKPTEQHLQNWKIKTYQSIIQGYERKKAAYDAAMSEASENVMGGGFVKGSNPAMNKGIIQNELKKGCLRWLFNDNTFPEQYNSWAVWYFSPDNDWLTRSDSADTNIPQMFRDNTAILLNEKIKFAENCFEWDILTYQLLPYYYGATSRWRKLYNLTEDDPQMQAFMQAGSAKVIVPVRPGFEEQALHLLANGYSHPLSTGGMLPAINSDIYYSVMEEIWESRQNEADQTPTPVGEPFKIKVPTSLVVLQCGSGCVEGNGLPCNCEGHEGAGAGTSQVLTGIGNNNPPTA